MFVRTFNLALILSLGLTGVNGLPTTSTCTSETQLAGAKQVPYAYNLTPLGASAEAFKIVPFASNCLTSIYANGLPGIVVASGGEATYDFAVLTRQLFSSVTGQYGDSPDGVAVIHTNVTLGVRDDIPIPVTFYADVYLTYNLTNCEIERVDAVAKIPTEILDIIINPPQLSLSPTLGDTTVE